jgi:hypothetical protein
LCRGGRGRRAYQRCRRQGKRHRSAGFHFLSPVADLFDAPAG